MRYNIVPVNRKCIAYTINSSENSTIDGKRILKKARLIYLLRKEPRQIPLNRRLNILKLLLY